MEWSQPNIFMKWEWNEVSLVDGMELPVFHSTAPSIEFMNEFKSRDGWL